jgi:endoglucanase
MMTFRLGVLPLLAVLLCPSAVDAVELRGVNLSDAEFGKVDVAEPRFGRENFTYRWPQDELIRSWVQDFGADVLRVPFRWERVQPELKGEVKLDGMARVVDTATGLGAVVVLDMHNFGNRWVMGEAGLVQAQVDGRSLKVTREDFAHVWARIAERFAGNEHVHFDLMNEPHGLKPAGEVSEAVALARFYQAAIDAIRATGARNPIHIEPPDYAKSSALVGSFSEAALSLRDPADALIFHVHQYLDPGQKGHQPVLAGSDTALGVKRLEAATRWARQHGKRLFLGEFAIPASGDARLMEATRRMIDHVEANADVWTGWTAWGAGSFWKDDYPFLLKPERRDTASMKMIGEWLQR